MDVQKQFFEEVLTKPYDHETFVKFIREFLDDVKLIAPDKFNKPFNRFSASVDEYSHIGFYEGRDNKTVAIFTVYLKNDSSVENARSLQRNFIKSLLEQRNCDGALVAFTTKRKHDKWRFSLVRMDYEFADGKLSTILTPAKRYSYLVGDGEPCNTAKQRLFPLFISDNLNPSLDELEEAFSVEKVTSEFFEQYKEKYLQLKEYLDSNEDFIEESKTRGFDSEQFAKKLLGQIVFLYFIQKKGWLGVNAIPSTMTEKEYKNAFFAAGKRSRELIGVLYEQVGNDLFRINTKVLESLSDDDETFAASILKGRPWGTGPKNFMRTLFDFSIKKGNNYFDDYLEPLFYDALNKNRGESGFYSALHCRIPFLNGGLFEQMDNYDWEHNSFDIPNEMFSNISDKNAREADGILDIFDRYNFTMAEDEPMEREVAIDPEMLGKVFENLLDVKDRKTKGAFYTPREIVHFMCQESLISHLTEKTKINEDDIRKFILYSDFYRDNDVIKTKQTKDKNGKITYVIDKEKQMEIPASIFSYKNNVNRLKEIDDLLANIKIVDPAVGSGAFPLGMLNEIVKARDTISAYMAIEMNGYEKKVFYSYGRSLYDLKINTIKNCIFACDIEPSAVDIAKLRLWLSIVIDDQITDNVYSTDFETHSVPRQLPNLECNIVCANSLIDVFEGESLLTHSELISDFSGKKETNSLFQKITDQMITELISLQDRLFFVKDHVEKEEIKSKIERITDEIILEQIGNKNNIRDNYYSVKQLPSKPFMPWHLVFPRVFRNNGGFDIVIGNPPYVSTKGVDEKEKPALKEVYGFADDLYNHFYFLGERIVRDKGNVSFITSKSFWTTQTKHNLRSLMLKNTLKYVYDTDNPFETAMVDTCIVFFTKETTDGNNNVRFIGYDENGSLKTYEVKQSIFNNAHNKAIFTPTEYNMKVYYKYNEVVCSLFEKWESYISTSKSIEKYSHFLEDYRNSLKPGDIALLGCLTDGGVGLQTGNNGKYIGVRKKTKWATNVLKSRPKKLEEAIERYNIVIGDLANYKTIEQYLNSLDEIAVASLFDNLKEEYGRDIFGQGYLYKLIDEEELVDVDSLTDDEKQNGISANKKHYVIYDKGDKDGNRWYLETPFAIAWTKENVGLLKADKKARYQGYTHFFKEGFCWSDINTTYLKCRIKEKSINDVKSMSMYATTESVPEYYLICLINSRFFSFFVDTFINNTQTFQINDARQLPIIIPSEIQLAKFKLIFEKAIEIKKKEFSLNVKLEDEITNVQKELDDSVNCLYGVDF